MATLVLWLLVFAFAGAFAAQVATRVRLIAAAPNNFSLENLPARIRRFTFDVLLQRQTIKERPVAGFAHALVFWGFVAFALYTTVEFLYGLGIVDLTETRWFAAYRIILSPFAVGVLAGIIWLFIRRAFVRPPGLGAKVSIESLVIAVFIATLMVTFLLGMRLDLNTTAGRINWWIHAFVILAFLALIPASKHFHLVLSPITVFLKSPVLGNLPNLDFEKEEVGLETVKDLKSKSVLDAFTCVECGRCQVNCPAWGAGKELNPKAIILQTQDALLAGERDKKLVDVYSEKVLWQCTTCGACENQCPVGIEHLPILIGARRGLVSNGEAPEYLGGDVQPPRTPEQYLGARLRPAPEVRDLRRARDVRSAHARCPRVARLRGRLRSRFSEVAAIAVRDPPVARRAIRRPQQGKVHRRSGEADGQRVHVSGARQREHRGSQGSGSEENPDVLPALREDDRRRLPPLRLRGRDRALGRVRRGTAAQRAVGRFRERRDRDVSRPVLPRSVRAARWTSRGIFLTRFGATIAEPERNRENPYCCGAGGGLLFADKEEEPGSRISDVRFKQLKATGANTVVTACPFCSIMLKGAHASAGAEGGDVQFVDLMTFVNGKLTKSADTTEA